MNEESDKNGENDEVCGNWWGKGGKWLEMVVKQWENGGKWSKMIEIMGNGGKW